MSQNFSHVRTQQEHFQKTLRESVAMVDDISNLKQMWKQIFQDEKEMPDL